jgi:hypothetical protein
MAKALKDQSGGQNKSEDSAKRSKKPEPRRVGAIAGPGASLGNIPITKEQLENVHPDTIDFRDLMYVPTLVEVPVRRTLEEYLACFKKYAPENKGPVLNQGKEGACSGFGLAAVANYLLWRRKIVPDGNRVSPRMFYDLARRYDEWPGENYSGSSARGAMKGWHKHGVCAEADWPYAVDVAGTLTQTRAEEAAKRPLGAYFRVNHENLVAMHGAIAEVGILYATAKVHEGWGQVGPDGKIPFQTKMIGGHAFAIVGYDENGFWIQNSWDAGWGKQGFGQISYDDWFANGTDVWVARLGAPVVFKQPTANGVSSFASLNARAEFSFAELRPHIISIGNNGELRPDGMFGTNNEDVQNIVRHDLGTLSANWAKKRLLLYAHGGLVSEENALQRVEEYRQPLLKAEVYPVAFVWKTDFWTTLKNILEDAFSQRRPEGFLDSAKDFMLNRLDDTLEPIARPIGKPIWGEMKENAGLATTGEKGGAKFFLEELKNQLANDPSWEIHIAGHSAGSIFMGPVVKWFAENKIPIASVTLWAPACTMKLFRECYLPFIKDNSVKKFSLFTLKDAAEQDDDCANIYHKSLLYLVSNAFEEKSGLFFLDGEPLLGMEQFIVEQRGDFKVPDEATLRKTNPAKLPLFGIAGAEWIRSPNGLPEGQSPDASHARHHGDFDDDKATVLSTLARITGASPSPDKIAFAASVAALGDCRRRL